MFSPSTKSDLQVPHEPAGGQPEIIPHHHDRLDMLAIAVPKCGDQFRVLLTSLGMEPLLELVQDQQHLLFRRQDATPAARLPANRPAPILGTVRDKPSASLSAAGLRSLPGSPRYKPEGRACQPGQKPRLDQRRLPATRGTVDQPDPESQVGVDLLDLSLPESDALRQSVSISRSGQEFQEEVGIVLIERSQTFGDDLDRSMVGVGLPGRGREWSGFQR